MSREDERMPLYLETLTKLKELYKYYGTTADFQTPDHVQRRLQAILGAETEALAVVAQKKALDSALMHVLSRMNTRTVTGVDSCRTWNKKINKAKSLAQMLEDKGQMQAAIRQWEKIKVLEEALANCRNP